MLTAALHVSAPSDHVVIQEMEPKVTNTLRFVPDVLVVCGAAYGDGRRNRYVGHEVHLTVEIVSDSSRSQDRLRKPHHYANAGIPLYWQVEFEPQPVIYTYRLGAEGSYEATGRFDRALETDQPWPLVLDITTLCR